MAARCTSHLRRFGALPFLALLVLGLVPALTVLGLIPHPSRQAHAAPQACVPGPHSGPLTTSQEWCADDNPHLVNGSVTVGNGVTLTIEPGVVVQFATSTELRIYNGGSLLAEGSQAQPIVFTSASASPAPGDWNHLYIYAGGQARLAHCDLAYAGRDGRSLHISSSDVEVRHCRVHHGSGEGVRLGELSGSEGMAPTLEDSQIDYVSGHAISQRIVDMAPIYRNLSLSDNGTDGLVLPGGNLYHNLTLDGPGSFNGKPIYFLGGTNVHGSALLTVTPGTTLRFEVNTGLLVTDNGMLRAEGTAAQPVTFTSAAAVPQPGDFWLTCRSYCRLAYCDVAYAGRGGIGGLELRTASEAWVRGCRIHHNVASGIGSDNSGGQPVVAYNQIEGNTSGLANMYPASPVDARDNWWGHATGPYHPTLNLSGQGQAVTDGVLFQPWLGTYNWIAPFHGLLHGTETLQWAALDTDPGQTLTVEVIVTRGGTSITLGSGLPRSGSLAWNTTAVANGLWELRARFRDGGGLVTGEAVRQVAVNNAAQVAYHGGIVGSSETWAADRVHVVQDHVVVAPGATLTLAPGAVVKFAGDTDLRVWTGGVVEAPATADLPIILTSLADDTAGGDTNLDGSLSLPQLGDWRGLSARTGGQLNLAPYVRQRYIVVEHAGTLAASETWQSLQVHRLTGDLVVPGGITLTLEPGALVKADRYRGITVQSGGRLLALGDEAEPVILTSVRDDTLGGDTNGDGNLTAAAPGDWGGIVAAGEAALRGGHLLYTGYAGGGLRVGSGAEVDFAGGLIRDSSGVGVAVSGTGRLGLSGSRIERNLGGAMVVDGDQAWVHVTGSSLVENGLEGNPGGGVRNNGTATVVLGGAPGAGNSILANAGFGAYQAGTGATMLATYNWWGDASGPKHLTLNPDALGEEVSDRVAFEPWLTESATLPAGTLVQLLAPLSFSPGETVNLGVQFANVLDETLHDVALVVQLPQMGEFVLSTGGGVYRPEEHDVVWRPGDVAPGESLDALVRVRTQWGLTAHSFYGAKALAAATNLPNPAVDLQEVLGYTPVEAVSQHYLTPGEITAELAADPQLASLLQEAQDLGFTFYDTALRETFSNGAELLTLALMDRARMDQMVYVRRQGEERTILRITPADVTEYSQDGGWRYAPDAVDWDFWGHLAPTAASEPRLRAECPTRTTPYPCKRACLITRAFMVMRYAIREVPLTAQEVWDLETETMPCVACAQTGTRCDACTELVLEKARGTLRTRLVACQDLCEKSPAGLDCQANQLLCGGPTSVFHVECNPKTCEYVLPAVLYTDCASEDRVCLNGCCVRPRSLLSGSSLCNSVASSTVDASLVATEDPSCACTSGICSVRALEARTAHDPNAKLGPAEAAAGEWISYTVQYENLGEGTAYGVYVEDQLSPVLDESTLQIDGGGLYFPASRSIYWMVGELGPGEGGSVDFRVQVPTEVVSGTVIVNSATVYFPSVPETTPTGDVVTLVQDLVAHSQRVETSEGVPLPITLTGYSPAGPLTFQIVQGPGGGTLSGTPPDVVYTPTPNFEGPDRLTFRVNDGLKDSAPAEVSIVVHTGAETIPPEIVAVSPSPGETGVRASEAPFFDIYSPYIYVHFSEPMDATTVTAQTLFLADANGRRLAGYATYSDWGYVARFLPQEPLQKGATYTATVTTGVRDTSGNALAAGTAWSFATEDGPAGGRIYLPLIVRN
jgi:uncharacterized repeat protein (TIGR01451 family)